MDYTAPNHYSYKFKFDIDRLPAFKKDRLSRKLSAVGIIIGLAFIILSVFEFISITFYTSAEKYDFDLPAGSLMNLTAKELMIQRYAFDLLIFVLGVAVLVISILALQRYKSMFFDGENIKIVHKPLFGEAKTEVDKLENYLGVLLRIEYYQLGLINRNRYIIELYHKDRNKRIPLYISTSSHKLRKIWEDYASKLRKPALFMTDHGLISRHYEELDKTIKEMSAKWHLHALYRRDQDEPNAIKCYRGEDRTVIKERRLFFDAYNILALFGLVVWGSLIVYAYFNRFYIITYTGINGFVGFMAVCSIIFLLAIMILFSKNVLIINQNSVVLKHKLGFINLSTEVLVKDKIEAVDIGHNPTTNRYYLSVISDEKNIVFGKNMPIQDLRWIRGFVIREVIK